MLYKQSKKLIASLGKPSKAYCWRVSKEYGAKKDKQKALKNS